LCDRIGAGQRCCQPVNADPLGAMAKRKWHERVREIAARNPDALHPSLRALAGKSPAWDRVSWQLERSSDVPADQLSQPISVVLRWLHGRRLLTKNGQSVAVALAEMPPENVALSRDLVSPKAHAFLDTHYDAWWERYGPGLVLGGASEEEAIAALDALWVNRGKSSSGA
jgi:hypothetical protein